MSRACTFCEVPLKGSHGRSLRNKEHAFPAWLQRHLKISTTSYPSALVKVVEQPKDVLDLGTVRITDRRAGFPLDAKQFGTVCKDCNGGWMGDLEAKVSQFLKPCLDGVLPLSSLNSDQSELLRQWTLKTAFVYEQVARHGTSMIDLELVRRVMRNEGLPPDLWLFGIQAPTPAPTYSVNLDRSWYAAHSGILSDEQVREFMLQTFKASFYLGRIVLTLAYVPRFQEGWLPVIWNGVHEQIAPGDMICQAADWSIDFPFFQAGIASQHGLMLSQNGWRPSTSPVTIFNDSGIHHIEVPTHEMAFESAFERAVQLLKDIHHPPADE